VRRESLSAVNAKGDRAGQAAGAVSGEAGRGQWPRAGGRPFWQGLDRSSATSPHWPVLTRSSAPAARELSEDGWKLQCPKGIRVRHNAQAALPAWGGGGPTPAGV